MAFNLLYNGTSVSFPRPEVQPPKMWLTVLEVINVVIGVTLVTCHVINISAMKRGEIWKPTHRWLLTLAMVAFLLIPCSTLGGSTVWIDWSASDEPDRCIQIPKYIAMTYVVLHQFFGLTMYERAKIVHEGLKIKSRVIFWFRIVLLINLTFGVWVVFGWSFWLNYAGKIAPEGVCIMYSLIPAVIISFAVLDSLISMSLILLFVIPLSRHTKSMAQVRSDHKQGQLSKVIHRNLVISLTLIVTDTATLLAMASILIVVHGRDVDPSLEYLQIWALAIPSQSLTIAVIGIHFMSPAWIPIRLRRLVFARTRTETADDVCIQDVTLSKVSSKAADGGIVPHNFGRVLTNSNIRSEVTN